MVRRKLVDRIAVQPGGVEFEPPVPALLGRAIDT